MTPVPSGGRRRAVCPVCHGVFKVRADGLLRRHTEVFTVCPETHVCAGSYVDCTSEGTAT